MKLTNKFNERVNEIKNKCGYIYQLTATEMYVIEQNYIHSRSIAEWERFTVAYIKRLKEEH